MSDPIDPQAPVPIAFAIEPPLTFTPAELIPLDDDHVAVLWPPGSETVLSVQPDGRFETRPRDQIGAWETATRAGDRLVFHPDPSSPVYVVPMVPR